MAAEQRVSGWERRWLASPERLGVLELREIIFSHPIDHLPGIA